MATITLACNGGTFLSYVNPNTDFSSRQYLPSSCYFLGYTTDLEESKKRQMAKSDNYNPYTYHFDHGGALLSFPENNVLKYKEIQAAYLHYEISGSQSGFSTQDAQLRRHKDGYREYISIYSTDTPLSNINLNNFRNVGNVSVPVYNELSEIAPLYTTYYNRVTDVTNLYKQIAGNQANFIISVGYSYRTTSEESYLTVGELTINNSESFIRKEINKATAYLEIIYNDVGPLPPTALYPSNNAIMESDTMTFTWKYNSATIANQVSATIQYKKSTDENWTTISSTGASTSITINNHLLQGSYSWRVKTINAIGEESAYSGIQNFDIIGKPASPIINTPDNKALTTISWQATGQEAAEILLYNSNDELLEHSIKATTQSTYKPQYFLKGNYNIKIRIKNNSDLWSDFAQKSFTIDGNPPNAGSLVVIPLETSIRLEWTAPESVNSVVIRREKDAETILDDTMGGNTYEDMTVKSGVVYEYILRTWTDGYTDSAPKQAKCNYSGAIISSGKEELHLEVSDDTFIPHSGEKERSHALDDFVGRDNPLLELGSAKRSRINKRFYVTPEELERFFEITQDLKVYYRDDHNNAFMAAITKQDYTNFNNSGYILQFELTRLAEEEVIINV